MITQNGENLTKEKQTTYLKVIKIMEIYIWRHIQYIANNLATNEGVFMNY